MNRLFACTAHCATAAILSLQCLRAHEEHSEPIKLTNAPSITAGDAEGHAAISPATGVSGQFGTWTVTYTAGPGGIKQGGGIRVQLPDSWHAGPRNSANRLQATTPSDDHFVSANTTAAHATVKAIVESETDVRLVKHAKPSLDGRFERYVFVVRVVLTHGELPRGQKIHLVYGDTSQGSRGYLAAAIATPEEPILMAVDANADGKFQLLPNSPMVSALPGAPVELLLHAPSQAVVGQRFRMLITAVDAQNNAVRIPWKAQLKIRTGSAEYPREVQVPEGRTYASFDITPTARGVLRISAEAAQNLSATSNPCDVSTELPGNRIYWGDLHSHSHFSWDGVGHAPFEYARWVSGLDFYALTDHTMRPPGDRTRGLSERQWEEYTALTDQHHAPPEFVTLHAYECSFGTPYGHHNVYFRDRPGPIYYPDLPLPELWKILEAGQALTIPHHTGKFPSGIDFGIHDPERRRNFEIYSGHGLSEAYNPAHPLAFEQSDFTSPAKSLKQPTFAQDVWRRGLILSTIAASDDHRSQPGQPHFGLTAIFAPSLSRENVFQALYDRRTYGTTGEKIILEFRADDVPMGRIVKPGSPLSFHIRALGTAQIEQVELLRADRSNEAGFQTIKTWYPGTLDFTTTFEEKATEPGAVYYVRLKQANQVRGRPVMAWSSPIFVTTE